MAKLKLCSRGDADAVVSAALTSDDEVRKFASSVKGMLCETAKDLEYREDRLDVLCEVFNFVFDQANRPIDLLSRKTMGCNFDFCSFRSKVSKFTNPDDMQQIQFMSFIFLLDNLSDDGVGDGFKDEIREFLTENEDNKNLKIAQNRYVELFPAAAFVAKIEDKEVALDADPYKVTEVLDVEKDEVMDQVKEKFGDRKMFGHRVTASDVDEGYDLVGKMYFDAGADPKNPSGGPLVSAAPRVRK